MGAHGVPQPRPQARPLVALMLMAVPVVVTVAMAMVTAVAVIVVRTDRGVHDIQHAPVNALPHIDKYQGRAVAN
jgi:hypothetical protein